MSDGRWPSLSLASQMHEWLLHCNEPMPPFIDRIGSRCRADAKGYHELSARDASPLTDLAVRRHDDASTLFASAVAHAFARGFTPSLSHGDLTTSALGLPSDRRPDPEATAASFVAEVFERPQDASAVLRKYVNVIGSWDDGSFLGRSVLSVVDDVPRSARYAEVLELSGLAAATGSGDPRFRLAFRASLDCGRDYFETVSLLIRWAALEVKRFPRDDHQASALAAARGAAEGGGEPEYTPADRDLLLAVVDNLAALQALRSGSSRSARLFLSRALELMPDRRSHHSIDSAVVARYRFTLLVNSATLDASDGLWSSAITTFRDALATALERDPAAEGAVRASLGYALHRAGDERAAYGELLEAERLHHDQQLVSSWQWVCRLLAVIAHKTGLDDEARAWLDRSSMSPVDVAAPSPARSRTTSKL